MSAPEVERRARGAALVLFRTEGHLEQLLAGLVAGLGDRRSAAPWSIRSVDLGLVTFAIPDGAVSFRGEVFNQLAHHLPHMAGDIIGFIRRLRAARTGVAVHSSLHITPTWTGSQPVLAASQGRFTPCGESPVVPSEGLRRKGVRNR